MVCLGNTRTCLGNSWWYQSPPEWGGGFVVAGHVTVPEPSRALEQEKSYPIHGCSGAPPRRGRFPEPWNMWWCVVAHLASNLDLEHVYSGT
jgi:hypothetical protein